MKIAVKLNSLLLLLFVSSLSATYLIAKRMLEANALTSVQENARIMMRSALAVRTYTSTQVKPLLDGQNHYRFLPQTVPSYAATEYFNSLSSSADFRDYAYKEATLNPTNPRDRAAEWELDVVNRFRQHPELNELVGEHDGEFGTSLYLAQPLQIKDTGCLVCHSTVSAAPQTMIDMYGTANGFGWKPNEIVGAQIVSVPQSVALRRAVKERTPVGLHGLRMDGDATHQLEITVEAIDEPKALEGMVIVVFREVAAPLAEKSRRKKQAGAIDPAIAAELLRSQEELKALREAMRASEEERQAAIEELQSTNEELQSANEELTTSKEEAQSMNEELQTINVELQSKLDDLALAQSDMQNLLNSTDIATLFLDKDLNVRRFTEQIKRIINLRDADIGRPLSDLTTTLNYPELHEDAQNTVRTLAFSEKEISTSDGQWFKVRVMPYRTVANVIQGAVITFVDITAAKQLESRLRKA